MSPAEGVKFLQKLQEVGATDIRICVPLEQIGDCYRKLDFLPVPQVSVFSPIEISYNVKKSTDSSTSCAKD